MRILRAVVVGACGVAVVLFALWAFGALYYDFPGPVRLDAWLFLAAVLAVAFWSKGAWKKMGLIAGVSGLVLAWWLTLRPTHDRAWQEDVLRMPWAEVSGDLVTVRDVRNFDYLPGGGMVARWETRTVDLSKLRAMDLAINYWGSPWMAHPIASFQFEGAPALAFSVETRKVAGQVYSAIGGLYRQYALIAIAADERDVLRLRANYREGETVYLYRTQLGREAARKRFLEYVEMMNSLKATPQWYHAVRNNCTAAVRAQRPGRELGAWDWRILVNGLLDEMLYRKGALVSDGMAFEELKAAALINAVAKEADADPEFSKRIREGRPGFGSDAPF